MKKIAILCISVIMFLSGCTASPSSTDASYTQITQEEAKVMMDKNDGHIIVDVRRQDEYDTEIILVYCRSGRRSKEAAQKLADMGYTNVYEFGGIIDWTGETVMSETETTQAVSATPVLVIKANGKVFYANLEDNSSAKAFIEKLSPQELTLELHDYGNFEKVGDLPWELPRNDEQITTEPGDVILYQGNQLTIYYDENTWDFTRIAKIGNTTREELLSAFGEGDVSVTMNLEWSE